MHTSTKQIVTEYNKQDAHNHKTTHISYLIVRSFVRLETRENNAREIYYLTISLIKHRWVDIIHTRYYNTRT